MKMSNNCLPGPPFCFLVDISPLNLFPLWSCPWLWSLFILTTKHHFHLRAIYTLHRVLTPHTKFNSSILVLLIKLDPFSLLFFINIVISVFIPPISINLSQCHKLLYFFYQHSTVRVHSTSVSIFVVILVALANTAFVNSTNMTTNMFFSWSSISLIYLFPRGL